MRPARPGPDDSRPIVRYDRVRGTVTIRYQSQTHVLPDRYETYDQAMIAGYAYARAQGWQTST